MRSGNAKAAADDAAGAAADWRRAAASFASHVPVGDNAIHWACCHGALARIAGVHGSGVSAAERAAHADEALAILRRAIIADGYREIPLIRIEPGLDSLRSRDDFRQLMRDLAFQNVAIAPFAWQLDEEYRVVPAAP
jgi:hypothetical protein